MENGGGDLAYEVGRVGGGRVTTPSLFSSAADGLPGRRVFLVVQVAAEMGPGVA